MTDVSVSGAGAEDFMDRDERARSAVLEKQRQSVERAEQERQEHLLALAERDEEARTELELMMEGLEEPERRLVRMHAYLRALEQPYSSPHDRQARVDQICLQIARYMVEGKA